MTSAVTISMKTRWARQPLGSWLMATVLFAVFVAVLACALLIEGFARAHAERRAIDSLRQISADFRDALDRGMAQQFQQVRVLAQLEQFRRFDDPPTVRHALDQVQLGFNHFAWIGLTDAQGKVLAAASGLLEGADVSKRPWWQGGHQAPFVGDVHAAVLLEKLLPHQAEPWRFVDFAVPIRDQKGVLQGVLGSHLSWTWARQIKNELIDVTMESHQAEALVVAKDGMVLLGPPDLEGKKLPDAAGLLDKPGTAQQTRFGGRDYFAVTAATRGQGSYPGLGWVVLLRQPTALALADYYRLRQQIVLTAGLLVALFVPLAWLLSRRLSAPLVQLAAAISARHHLGQERMPRVSGYREVELLSGALADLSDRQAEQDAMLEHRVEARTTELHQAMQRLRVITNNLPVLISYIDDQQRLQFTNETLREWLGIDPQAAVGHSLQEVFGPALYELRREAIGRALKGERIRFDTETQLQGVHRHLQTEYIPDVRADGTVAGIYSLSTDITAAKAVEQHLSRLVRVDALTGGANRRQFEERLPEAMARSRRSQLSLALLFLDIDRFKHINDQLGHAAGDAVLREFALRLNGCVRATDTVARLGGDEFVLILEGLHSSEEPELVARKILSEIERPFEIEGRALQVSTSIGIASYRGGSAGETELLARADAALYEAKAAGRGCYRSAPVDATLTGS